MVDIIRGIEREQMRDDIPDFQPGDTVRALVRVVEGTRERTQAFEGVVIRRRSGGLNENFTIRRISANGIGVERTFRLHSPRLERIEVVRLGKVRRAKLYYLRGLTGRAARIKERRPKNVAATRRGATTVTPATATAVQAPDREAVTVVTSDAPLAAVTRAAAPAATTTAATAAQRPASDETLVVPPDAALTTATTTTVATATEMEDTAATAAEEAPVATERPATTE